MLRVTKRCRLEIFALYSGPAQTQTSQELPSKLQAKKSAAAKPHWSKKNYRGDHGVLAELGNENSGPNDAPNEKTDVRCAQ